MPFRNYRMSKTWLDHTLKSTVSKLPLTVNILKRPKLLSNLHKSTFIIFFITLRGNDLRNVPLSELRNIRGVC